MITGGFTEVMWCREASKNIEDLEPPSPETSGKYCLKLSPAFAGVRGQGRRREH